MDTGGQLRRALGVADEDGPLLLRVDGGGRIESIVRGPPYEDTVRAFKSALR
jgi:hypothetical protein